MEEAHRQLLKIIFNFNSRELSQFKRKMNAEIDNRIKSLSNVEKWTLEAKECRNCGNKESLKITEIHKNFCRTGYIGWICCPKCNVSYLKTWKVADSETLTIEK